MNLQTYKACKKKKITRFISSVYQSVKITYHQQNTICNFIGELTIVVKFTIILFQLFKIYRRSSLSLTPSVIVTFIIILFELFRMYWRSSSVSNLTNIILKIFFKSFKKNYYKKLLTINLNIYMFKYNKPKIKTTLKEEVGHHRDMRSIGI
jgi:hypothetical protein